MNEVYDSNHTAQEGSSLQLNTVDPAPLPHIDVKIVPILIDLC